MNNQIKSEIKLNKAGDTRGMSINSRKNLRNDASPGRPHKPDCLVDCFREELSKVSLNGKETNEQLIAAVVVGLATRGNLKAVEILAAYLHAKPTSSMELRNPKGESFSLEVGVIDQETKKALDSFMKG